VSRFIGIRGYIVSRLILWPKRVGSDSSGLKDSRFVA
jgi:hypothetical protein